MKYAFIVNPASGQGKHDRDLVPRIEEIIAGNPNKDIKMYFTCGEKDATVLADCIAKEAGDQVVIFACGGDGTIQEVANGVYGNENAILGIVPAGSGNDFVRELGNKDTRSDRYLDLNNIFDGVPTKVDLIKMSWIEDTEEKIQYVINGINIGFDGYTCVLAHELKKLPLVSGTGSYLLAVAKNLAAKKGEKLRITVDGTDFHTGKLLLTTIANGGYCGGGIQSCANADLTDGLLEVLAIKDVSRTTFVRLFPKFKAGKLFSVKGVENFASYTQGKNIIVEPMQSSRMLFVADGEIYETGALRIEVMPRAISVLAL